MPIWYNDNGTWKQTAPNYCKVSGVWKPVRTAYVKVSNAWKKFYQMSYIPSGAIIQFADTGAAPSGWSEYMTGEKWIRAWNVTGDIESTGGSRAVAFTSIWEASHNASSYGSFNARAHNIAGGIETVYTNNLTQGGHSHDVVWNTNTRPYRFDGRLIQADSDQAGLPINGVCFADRSLSGMTEVNVSDCAAHISDQGGAINAAVQSETAASASNEGAHRHWNLGADYAFSANPQQPDYVGNHAHGGWSTSDLTWQMYRILLKAFYSASAVISPKAGMIVGYPSDTAPPGWALCNGSNGTIDLRDYYIGIDSSQTPGTTKGTGKAQFNFTVNNEAHRHTGSTVSLRYYKAAYHNLNVSHNHNGYRGITWDYNYIKLAFIQWVG